MQLFGACYLPIFFTLAFFLNLAAWSYGRINYTLIFEFDVRTRMQYVQFIELPALLFLILSLFFWAAFNNFWPGQIEPSAYPLAWVVTTVVVRLLLLLSPPSRADISRRSCSTRCRSSTRVHGGGCSVPSQGCSRRASSLSSSGISSSVTR